MPIKQDRGWKKAGIQKQRRFIFILNFNFFQFFNFLNFLSFLSFVRSQYSLSLARESLLSCLLSRTSPQLFFLLSHQHSLRFLDSSSTFALLLLFLLADQPPLFIGLSARTYSSFASRLCTCCFLFLFLGFSLFSVLTPQDHPCDTTTTTLSHLSFSHATPVIPLITIVVELSTATATAIALHHRSSILYLCAPSI